MKYRYEDESVIPLIEGEVTQQINEEEEEAKVEKTPAEEEEYYELPLAVKSRSRIWSVMSFVFSILSVLLCLFYYVSLPLALLSVGFALLSRKILGFFDRFAVLGLIIGIFGTVAGVFSMIAAISGITDAIFSKK